MNFIAIDCGASFLKGALIKQGIIVKQVQENAPKVTEADDILVPRKINALLTLVKKIIKNLLEDESEVTLCISNEMHGFLLANKEGQAITDYISWQNEFGNELVNGQKIKEIFQGNIENEDLLFTGMPLRAGLPSCNILYLNSIYSKRNEAMYFYTLGDYIIRRLAEKEPYCHPTNAAATGLYDLRTGNWNSELIIAAKGEKIVFPKIGFQSLQFKFEDTTVNVLPAIGDQQAALLGSGLIAPNAISYNLGTGAQVSRLIDRVEIPEGFQVRPYFNEMYLKTIPHIPSGRALNVYIRFVKDILRVMGSEIEEEKLWFALLEEEKKVEHSSIKCDLSFFENAITNGVRGNIENIGEYSLTIGNLLHSIFEQMADNFYEAGQKLGFKENEIAELIFSGGVARKINRIRSNILRRYSSEITVTIAENETLLGLYCYGKEQLLKER